MFDAVEKARAAKEAEEARKVTDADLEAGQTRPTDNRYKRRHATTTTTTTTRTTSTARSPRTTSCEPPALRDRPNSSNLKLGEKIESRQSRQSNDDASYPRGSRLIHRVPRVDRHVVRHVQPRDARAGRPVRPVARDDEIRRRSGTRLLALGSAPNHCQRPRRTRSPTAAPPAAAATASWRRSRPPARTNPRRRCRRIVGRSPPARCSRQRLAIARAAIAADSARGSGTVTARPPARSSPPSSRPPRTPRCIVGLGTPGARRRDAVRGERLDPVRPRAPFPIF